jgi:NTE family protein
MPDASPGASLVRGTPDDLIELAAIPTRLAPMSEDHEERLINWGYAICDTAMRMWVDRNAPPPARFPYPARGV